VHYQKFAQVGGKTQSFSLISSPSDVFNRRNMYGRLVGEDGGCAVQTLDFDVSTAVLKFSFADDSDTDTGADDAAAATTHGDDDGDDDAYAGAVPGICTDLLGQMAAVQAGAPEFRVSANMNSLSLAAAINARIVGMYMH
jgi:hypothetical protein